VARLKLIESVAALIVLASGGLTAPRAQAAIIPLFNTGVDAAGVPLLGGAADPHWTIVAGDGVTTPFPAQVLTNPVGIYAVSPVSRWVWAEADGQTGLRRNFTFRLTFDLSGLDPETAEITGRWGVDNIGEIFLNGSNVGIGSGELVLPTVTAANFNTFHAFTLDDGFVSGINMLDFVVRDTAQPAGLNVTDLAGTASAAPTTAVPEPASFVLFAVGGTMLAGWASRRRRTR
jgi:hypothetical protein